MAQVIVRELEALKKAYGKKRRTVIENGVEAVFEEKKIEEMEVIFLMDRFGYCRTVDAATYERNKEAADAENRYVFPCKNTGRVCLFTSGGQLHTIKAADVPFGKFRDKGVPVDNISNFNIEKENLIYATSQTELNLYRVLFVTRQSMVKVVDGGEFDVMKRTVASTKLLDGDEVLSVEPLIDQKHIVLQSKDGYFLRFPVEEISAMKKAAVGTKGMKLGEGDYLEAAYYTRAGAEQTIEYKGKKIELGKLKAGTRAGKGVKVRV